MHPTDYFIRYAFSTIHSESAKYLSQ